MPLDELASGGVASALGRARRDQPEQRDDEPAPCREQYRPSFRTPGSRACCISNVEHDATEQTARETTRNRRHRRH